MKRLLLPVALCLAAIAFAQKKVSLKKNTVKQDDQVIAEFDGEGSMFKMVKLGVFAPGSKDTLIRVTEDNYDAKNPLFPKPQVVYKIEFPNSTEAGFFVQNPKNPNARGMEKATMEVLFNDRVPVLINGGKLDVAAVQAYRTSYSFDFEKLQQTVKNVEDSIGILSQVVITRDRSKPLALKSISNRGDAYYAEQEFEIYQDGALLGKIMKQTSGAAFPKSSYSFWKKIEPVTLGGINTSFAPVAICATGPNGGDIPVTMIVGKKQVAVKGAYNALETPVANLLVQMQIL